MSAQKDVFTALEEFLKKNEKGYVTYDELIEFFPKQPTSIVIKKIEGLLKKYSVTLLTSAEIAKMRNLEEAKKREQEKQKLQDETLEDEFDLVNEKELLEWSRSDSPVRMYLREMGQISLLTKDEEIFISKKIELGEDIIIDAFCSVPYLIDFILEYKEALVNRERRVKELFKSFDDELEDEEESDLDEDEIELDENGENKRAPTKKELKRS
ncbi:MAG: RNA polymerase sigma factor RpoD, partial [Campylobacteraceae bacterium]|nr:RNA polymerase sigma factor RpoD [Campylobacteraceae bacterium]